MRIMHWWQGAFTSSSKSKSSDDSIIATRTGFFSSRRNRLLRKLRQATENDVDTWRSPSCSQNSSARSAVAPSSAPPQPLPLPELRVLLQNDPKLTPSSSSCNVPLPSPDAYHMPRGLNDDRETIEATRIVGQDSTTYSERYDARSSRRSPQNQHSKKKSLDCYNLNTPISAPASPYSSTVLSPPRTDMWASHYITPPGIFQVWSAPEMPHSDGNLGLGFSFEKPTSNVDNSALHSPRVANHLPATSPPRSTSPLTLQKSTDTRWESNAQATVHPLPLPPTSSMPILSTPRSPVGSISDFSGASMPSQPSPISPVGSRPELKPIKSQWQKGKLIGRGTFGSVYVASNRETGALCAMKEVEILPDDSKSAECMRQLEQEIKVLSHLKHPNIVQYYGSEIVGDKFYIYLEYVHPGSINKFIHDHCGAITESVVRNFTRHILCGLAYLHSTKTIHRDIKGANLLVDAYGVVKLADFGMAKHLNGQTANLSLKGSPYWMAPELLQSAIQTDASSDIALAVDIWSLGCTIIEMMNGQPPWSEYEGAAALFKVLKETPPIPSTMSAEGKDFLQCCFRRNPADRPTASKLLEHPFLSYSQQPDSCSQSLNEMKSSDNMQFLRQRPRHKQDQAPWPLTHR